MELLIKEAKIVDASKDTFGDIYIKDGIIEEIADNLTKTCKTIYANGLTLMPAFVDTHTHFREPGLTYKEDLLTGSMAASRGGYTGVNLMPNTKPVVSNMDLVNKIIKKSKQIGLVDVHQCVSITRDFTGKDISHINDIKLPVSIITEDGYDVDNSSVMLEAMKKAKENGLTVMVHCEDKNISKIDFRLAENLMTFRNIELSKVAGCSLHVAHVSTKESMEYVKSAKNQGYPISCEVMPHHIALIDEVNYRVNPPLRTREDLSFLIDSIKKGYVEYIGTDHAPHSKKDKEDGAPGISGIETSFIVCYTTLVKSKAISLSKLSELMSKNPAKLLGFNKGLIEVGYEGDLVLLDLEAKQTVDTEKFASKGKNSPFNSMEFSGEVICTIKSGKIVYEKDNWTLGNGEIVTRDTVSLINMEEIK